jgi:hypothetical protein
MALAAGRAPEGACMRRVDALVSVIPADAEAGKRFADEHLLYELEGKKGSATEVIRDTFVAPGESATVDVTKPLDPGDYVMLCPLVGKEGLRNCFDR